MKIVSFIALFFLLVKSAYAINSYDAGLYAKLVCSGVFVSGRSEKNVVNDDLKYLPKIDFRILYQLKEVHTSADDKTIVARYSSTNGCQIVRTPSSARYKISHQSPTEHRIAEKAPIWITRKNYPDKEAHLKLQQLVKSAFVDEDPKKQKKTLALLVIQGNEILAEEYADGIDRTSKFPGYSMSTAVANLLTGIMVKKDFVTLDEASLFDIWKNDKRRYITAEHLLRMTSGLDWQEYPHQKGFDVPKMFAGNVPPAQYVQSLPLRKPFEPNVISKETRKFEGLLGGAVQKDTQEIDNSYDPGMKWNFSSGDIELLSELIKNRLVDRGLDYKTFITEELFQKLEANSMMIDIDQGGAGLLSMFVYANAQDWARVGIFLLDEASTKQQSILPPNWLADSLKETKIGEEYSTTIPRGAGFWLASNDPEGIKALGTLKSLDTFYVAGFLGQYLIVVPSLNLVVVRLGATADPRNWDMGKFMDSIFSIL